MGPFFFNQEMTRRERHLPKYTTALNSTGKDPDRKKLLGDKNELERRSKINVK